MAHGFDWSEGSDHPLTPALSRKGRGRQSTLGGMVSWGAVRVGR